MQGRHRGGYGQFASTDSHHNGAEWFQYPRRHDFKPLLTPPPARLASITGHFICFRVLFNVLMPKKLLRVKAGVADAA